MSANYHHLYEAAAVVCWWLAFTVVSAWLWCLQPQTDTPDFIQTKNHVKVIIYKDSPFFVGNPELVCIL